MTDYRDYDLNVDTQSWGACLCWENGGRRSKWGLSPKCVSAVPVNEKANDTTCTTRNTAWAPTGSTKPTIEQWCTKDITSENQVCPLSGEPSETDKGMCEVNGVILDNLPDGLKI